MIPLTANALEFPDSPVASGTIFRISSDEHRPLALRQKGAFVLGHDEPPEGFGWYIWIEGRSSSLPTLGDKPVVRLPKELAHLSDGDIVRISPGRNDVRVLFRKRASINSFLLTERCNNLCLMCSQPPRNVQDGWLVDEIIQILQLIDFDVPELMFSGGEPTLLGERFFELVRASKSYLPRTALHVLSNGRTFSDPKFAQALAAIEHPDLMIGIPLYSDLSHVHDFVVQADGAYDETIRGILNLKNVGVPVEIRVVLHKQTVPRLTALAEFITRNLLFVDHVALMGLEIAGFTKANLNDLWIDPADYREELRSAVGILDRARIRTSIYNNPLCLIDKSVWRFAKRSISDWKQEYMPECEPCTVKEQCGGFFSSAFLRHSDHIRAILD